MRETPIKVGDVVHVRGRVVTVNDSIATSYKVNFGDADWGGWVQPKWIVQVESNNTNIYELHEKMTAHLFPAYSPTDERF